MAAAPNLGQIRLSHGSYTFFSDFDSGNMAKCVPLSTNNVEDSFEVWTNADCAGSSYETAFKTWFYFGVKGCTRGKCLSLTMRNMNLQGKLYSNGLKPFYRIVDAASSNVVQDWRRIPLTCSWGVEGGSSEEAPGDEDGDDEVKGNGEFVLRFRHVFETGDPEHLYYFSYHLPYSFEECCGYLRSVQRICLSSNIYSRLFSLAKSLENRDLECLTIHEQDPKCTSPASRKRVVVLTARVHPGESPASYMFNGFVDFLVSKDPRAVRLRQEFVFHCLPCLNPDGVARGHYRADTAGRNLNRFYSNATKEDHPTIYALKEFMLEIHRDARFELFMFLDMHAHASKRGVFVYGNNVEGDDEAMADILLYPRLLSLNDPNFDFGSSVFSAKAMKAKDRRDGLSKEDSGRVCMFRETGLRRIYTLECNYATGRMLNLIAPISGSADALRDPHLRKDPSFPTIPKYDNIVFENSGVQAAVALLDIIEANPLSRLRNTEFKDASGVRASLLKARIDSGSAQKAVGNRAFAVASKSTAAQPIRLARKSSTMKHVDIPVIIVTNKPATGSGSSLSSKGGSSTPRGLRSSPAQSSKPNVRSLPMRSPGSQKSLQRSRSELPLSMSVRPCAYTNENDGAE